MSAYDRFVEEDNKKWAVLNANDKAAKKNGTVVGRYVTHSYADGEAVYLITGEKDDLVTIEHVAVGDAWTLPAWGKKCRIEKDTALSFLAHRDAWNRIAEEEQDWWASKKPGDVVFYYDGPGSYVRGTVVESPDGNKMLPTALLGSWNSRDLSLNHYWVDMIVSGTLARPHATNMWGNSGRKDVKSEPNTLPEIDLSVYLAPKSYK